MKCPCCGQSINDLPIEALRELSLTRTEKRLVDVLIAAYPNALQMPDVVAAVYGTARLPDDASGVMRTMASRVRPRMKAIGWTISKSHGQGIRGGFKLERVDEATS